MRYVSIFPKKPMLDNVLGQLKQAHGPYGGGIRVSTEAATLLHHQKPIRELIRNDMIDIVSRQNGPRRSIIYLPPNVKIEKKEGKYFFFW